MTDHVRKKGRFTKVSYRRSIVSCEALRQCLMLKANEDELPWYAAATRNGQWMRIRAL
jgi:hypothetical protein